MKRALKILGIVALILFLGVSGLVAYRVYTFHRVVTVMQEKKAKRPARPVVVATAEPAHEPPAKSACNAIYVKYIENRNFMDAIGDLAEQGAALATVREDDPCVKELEEALDYDKLVGLLTECQKNLAARQSRLPCADFVGMIWGVFAEVEYPAVDPEQLSVDALHGKIIFRLADRDFVKNAGIEDKEYFYRLLTVMEQKQPEKSYGTTREELLGDLYAKDPAAWKNEFDKTLEELEEKGVSRAVNAFLRGNDQRLDSNFFEYVEGLAERHPDDAWAHYYKSCAYTGLKDWESAARELNVAEGLNPKIKESFGLKLREAIDKKTMFIATHSWTALNLGFMGV